MEINDEYIIQEFINNQKHINSSKCRDKWLQTHQDIYNYLINRYKDSKSISETIYRIYNNIECRPVCEYCGGELKYSNGFRRFCSNACIQNSPAVQEKRANTCMERFGVDNAAKSEKITQQTKETNIKRYGVPVPIQNNIIKEKIKQTCIEKYGVDNAAKSEKIIQQIKETNIKKYGCTCVLQNKEILNNIHQTCIEKYGVESYSQSDEYKQKQSKLMSSKEMQERRNAIQKEHHTFNSSKIEQQFKEYLEQNYPNDFEYQYRSELYPFNCDFYIKSLDLYIEIQGSWTHGRHPFDENNQEDIDKLNLWKSKNTKYYNVAIKVWTDLDVRKRTIAKENKLNYLEIFSNNIYKCIEVLNNHLN